MAIIPGPHAPASSPPTSTLGFDTWNTHRRTSAQAWLPSAWGTTHVACDALPTGCCLSECCQLLVLLLHSCTPNLPGTPLPATVTSQLCEAVGPLVAAAAPLLAQWEPWHEEEDEVMWALVQAVCQLPVSITPFHHELVSHQLRIGAPPKPYSSSRRTPARISWRCGSAAYAKSVVSSGDYTRSLLLRAPHALARTFFAPAARPPQAASDALGTGDDGSVAHSLATQLADALTTAPAAAADRAARTAHTLLTSVAATAAAPVAAVLSVAAFERLRHLVRGLGFARARLRSLALAPTLIAPATNCVLSPHRNPGERRFDPPYRSHTPNNLTNTRLTPTSTQRS
jgi:hypothetical protein